MESNSSSPLLFFSQTTIPLALFSLFTIFTAVFSLLAFLVYLLRLKPYWCNCHVCRSYLTSSWTADFDNLCDWYTHLLKKSPTGTIHVHVINNVITSNPVNVEYMLKTNFANYPKGKPFSAILGDILGRGIFNVDGETWRFQRKMASLELGSVSIRHFAYDVVSKEINFRLVPILSKFSSGGELVDLQDVFKRFSFDSICKFSFGLDPKCLLLSLPDSELADAFDMASTLSARWALYASPVVWKFKRVLNLGSERKLRESVKVVKRKAEEIIQEKRLGSGSKLGSKDLLSRFMSIVDNDDYLRDIVISFLLAGRDTVASGLTSLFWLLSQNPNVVDRIREEASRVLGDSGPETQDPFSMPSFDQMKKMHYLNATVHESLRMFPPVQFDSKFTLVDDLLPDGTFVKAGTRVTYHQYAMGRMDRIWGPDCLEFKPERWLKNGSFVPENPFKYPVFHAGFRVCLGKEMALVEMKSVALAVVQGFNIRIPDPSHVPRFVPGLTATVRGGLPVLVEER